METEYMLKFLGLRLLFAAGLIGVVALIIINPFASERDLVEENIRVGLAADAGSWRVFDPDLDGRAARYAATGENCTTIKPVLDEGILSPYNRLYVAINQDERAAALYREEEVSRIGVGVAEAGNGEYRVCVLLDTERHGVVPLF